MRVDMYKLPNGRQVFLSSRPDRIEEEDIKEIIKEFNPGIRLQFTDDWVDIPKLIKNIEWHWYPWVPLKRIPMECFWGFLMTISRWNESTDPSKAMWMHCDSSSMRAPTYFGLFLRFIYPEEAHDVVDKADHSRAASYWSCPKRYADVELEKSKAMSSLLKAWQEGGEPEAYAEYMGKEFIS